jgi:hypothetical protein
MTVSEGLLRRYLRVNIPKYKSLLKLDLWDIRWKVEKLEGTAESMCRVNPSYYTLDVFFDSEKIKDVNHLRETVTHELLHAVIGQYEVRVNDVVNQLSPQASGAMNEVLYGELERTVTHLERVIVPLLEKVDELEEE